MESGNSSGGVAAWVDRLAMWLTRHWLAVINVALVIYIGLPFLAPVLEETGHPGPAQAIYTIYRTTCHELPQRSYFLYGEKTVYSLNGLVDRVGLDNLPGFPFPNSFIGNYAVGYKVALCQRDLAIYGSLLFSGLAFSLVRSRVRPLPFWAYILIGVIPIGLDGGSQFISYLLPAFVPNIPIEPRESTWVLRTITGALFGLATAWLAFPNLQSAFAEIAEQAEVRKGTRD